MEHVADRLTLFLFRHGETDWNREGRLQGHTDTQLNANGIAQAEALAQRLLAHRLDALVSSDLSRALTTARIIGEILNVPVITDHGLREVSVGLAEGMLWEEAKARFGAELTERWYSDDNVAFPGGETGAATLTRGLAAIRRFADSLSASPHRGFDAWRDGATPCQTCVAGGRHTGQSPQCRPLCPRLRAGNRSAGADRGRLAVPSGERTIALDLGAMHQPSRIRVEFIAAVQDTAIVPHDEIADAPLLIPGEFGLARVFPQCIEQGFAVSEVKALDVGVAAAAEKQRLAAGDRMGADDRMVGAGSLARIADLGIAAAQFAGTVAA